MTATCTCVGRHDGHCAFACQMCAPYDRPGFVLNAGQWVKCWQCNQHDERDTSDEPSASERRLAERRGIAASTIGANWGDVR